METGKTSSDAPELKWNRIYFFILGYNAFLIIIFYMIRLFFNHNQV